MAPPPAAYLGSHELLTHIDDRREVVAVRYFLSHPVDVNQYRPARVVLRSLETFNFLLDFLDDPGADWLGGKPDFADVEGVKLALDHEIDLAAGLTLSCLLKVGVLIDDAIEVESERFADPGATAEHQILELQAHDCQPLRQVVQGFEAEDVALNQRQLFLQAADYRRAMTELDCFGEGSLFSKILPKTLTPQQWATREKSIRDASDMQHLSTIHWAAGSLDIWLQLGTERREKLEKLLIQRTRAPRKFGEYDYYGLVYQMSRMPEQELKPIFDEEQWQKIGRQFAEAQRLEKTLKLGGFLPEADVADAGKSRPTDSNREPEHPRS